MNNFSRDCFTCRSKKCSVLKNCDANILSEINSKKVCKEIHKGEILFSEGDEILGVYLIKKGFLKVDLNGKIGRPLISHVASHGAIFGHRIAHNKNKHTSTVVALEDSEYCFIPQYLFQEVAVKCQSLRDQISLTFLEELEMAEKGMIFLAHKTVREKVAIALQKLAKIYHYNGKTSFKIHFNRLEIADFAGTTKEQVSKILNEYIDLGLVKCKAKTFYYLNIPELQKISTLEP